MTSVISMLVALVVAGAVDQHPSMPAGMTHEQHLAQMKKEAELKQRGAAAMGFDQDAATHHFLVTRDGGIIRVEAKNAKDDVTRDAIRSHLAQIANAFAAGQFDAPQATHAEEPPGVPVMRRLAASIRYRYEATAAGGQVTIASAAPDAVAAVHEFLRYQIREHRTGDPEVR